MIHAGAIPGAGVIRSRTISPLGFIIKIYTVLGARELVKCVRATVALAEEQGSVPITHMVPDTYMVHIHTNSKQK